MCPEDAAIWRASGRTVFPPERYAEGIPHSEASSAAPVPDQAPYRGNSVDVTALVATAIGLSGIASCFGLAYAIPFVAFALGLIGWLQAKDSINPGRTRLLSGVGMASGGVFLLGGFLFVTLCLACFILSLAAPGNRTVTFGASTPTPFFFVTPTP
ncbi:MAG: hypothetical protein HY260_10150 [Chloroflexi bacterium]|nr:hypothetical protein [Chloroflexota bacterium]